MIKNEGFVLGKYIDLYYHENEDRSCKNCGDCQCLSCAFRESAISRNYTESDIVCNRCDCECEDIPMEGCKDYLYTDD